MPSTRLGARPSASVAPMQQWSTFAWIVICSVAARLPFLLRADRFFDSDEAVEGLMARHLGDHSLFLWGQRYKGTPEVLLSGAVFRIAAASVVALKAVTLACFIAFLCLNFVLVERVFSRRIAWTATALAIAGPPSLVFWSLSGSAEVVMTLLIGALMLIAVEQRNVVVAAAAAGVGLWIQQYILYYVAALAITWVLIEPAALQAVRDAVRSRVPVWLRGVTGTAAVAAAVYVGLGFIAFVGNGLELRAGGLRITATHPQKMWWIAGGLAGASIAAILCAVFRRALIRPAAAFLAGYSPAVIGRIGNHGMGAPISRLDAAGLRAAFPDITHAMLPTLFGWLDPTGTPTVPAASALVVLAIAALSYWSAWRRMLNPFFHVMPIVAAVMFLVGGAYVDAQSYRYLMPIYAALPIVFAIGVDELWRAGRLVGAAVLAGVVLLFAIQQVDWYRRLVPDADSDATIACLDRSGVRFARARYWQSYKLTFLTGERVIVSPIDGVDRYAPYTEATRAADTLDAIRARCEISTSPPRS